jgi:orc1/cdc6 family replication initiation protein
VNGVSDGSAMIVDARVLRPEFVPRDVVHRDSEVRHLSNALAPILDGDPAETALLCGPSGAGKTCIARFAVSRLRENALDVDRQYVNCWEDSTRFKTLYRLLEGLDRAFDIHRQSTPKDELLERLRDHDGPPYVVVLDEADQLDDTGVLYDLYRLPGLTMVLIANDETELFSRFDDRLVSRLQTSTRVRFEKYRLNELVSILEDRVRWGLREGIITTEQLTAIADAAAGDARVAIGILRTAARRADRQAMDSIPGSVIEMAVPEAKAEITRKDTEKLTADQRTLYEIVAERGGIAPGELYERYTERVGNPKTKRMVRNYLRKLRHYNLIAAEGENRGRTYRPVS